MGRVAGGSVVGALEREKMVDSRKRLGVIGRNAHLAAARQLADLVADLVPSVRHHSRARDLRDVVHEPGDAEVPLRKRARDVGQVRPYLLDAGRIVHITLKLDSATVGKIVEQVGGRVLIDPHGRRRRATRLKLRELSLRETSLSRLIRPAATARGSQ